jgi:hypothetical protein
MLIKFIAQERIELGVNKGALKWVDYRWVDHQLITEKPSK